jgi:hypothetical protein
MIVATAATLVHIFKNKANNNIRENSKFSKFNISNKELHGDD